MMENRNSKKKWFNKKNKLNIKIKCEKKCHILYLFLNNRILLIFYIYV